VISGLGPGAGARMGVRTLVSKDGKLETVINDYGPKTPTITVISHEDHPPYDSVPRQSRSSVPPPLPPHGHLIGHHIPASYQYGGRGLPRQGSSSLESSGGATAPIHVHTAECSQRGQFPPQHPPHGTGGRGSPPEPLYCDFHCCALHEEGRKIQVIIILVRSILPLLFRNEAFGLGFYARHIYIYMINEFFLHCHRHN